MTSVLFENFTIGERIRHLIAERGYTQVELAQKTGLTQPCISNLVTDASRKPSAPTLLKLAAALSCNPQWILDGNGDAPISNEERSLIAEFRRMDEPFKLALLASARALNSCQTQTQ